MPSWEQQKRNITSNRAARAPYNFVPLPEAVVTAVDDPANLPDHDIYDSARHTGHFDVTLTTRSPLYIRAPLTLEEFQQQTDDKPDFFYTRDKDTPIIPGSSLRGVLHNLLEIVSYGKIERVTNYEKIFYRAVAAKKHAPLKQPYDSVLGKNGQNVRSGYLRKKNNEWYIQPAFRKPSDAYDVESSYIKVDDATAAHGNIPDFISLDDPNYEPQYHNVTYEVEVRYIEINPNLRIPYYEATKISADRDYSHHGVLTCAGNMMESGSEDDESQRRYHALVPSPDLDAELLHISSQAVQDYRDALTSFQKEKFDDADGCLKEGNPVFYVAPEPGNNVRYFGHSPNFRIPALITDDQGTKRAATPKDFVPAQLRRKKLVDYKDALFGYTKGNIDSDGKASAYAGRVSVTSAHLEDGQDNIWYADEPIVPSILSTPKPTCFQHYLVQDSEDIKQLNHYDSETPDETVIRGHKLYWHKGNRPIPEDPEAPSDSTQHTQFKPVDAGVRFSFRVDFENLSCAELGALCWVLHPQGDPDREYCHKLGMGKPLGMGSVNLETTLHLDDRHKRYESLFSSDGWATGDAKQEISPDAERFQEFVADFEEEVLKKLARADVEFAEEASRLRDLGRIGVLLKMMEWPGPSASRTKYMELEDFENRPVLPSPAAFGQLTGELGLAEKIEPRGRVKWFSAEKGYGFIEPVDGGEDVFVHTSEVQGLADYQEALREGEPLDYEVERTPKGLNAVDVRRLNP